MSLWNKLSGGIMKAKDGWMVDSESHACLLCKNTFSLTVRRHHCRVCYRLVCGTCSNHNLEIDDDGCHHRVCDDCFTKLGSGGLVGQDASFGEQSVTYFRVTILSADISSSIREDLRLAMGKFSPSLYCVAFIDSKPIKGTDAVSIECMEWNESFDIRVNLQSPLESHLTVELRDRSRRVTGEELLGTARIALARCSQYAETSGSYLLMHKGRKTSHSVAVNIVRRSCRLALNQMPDLPMYSVHVPCAVKFSCFPGMMRKQREVPMVHIFPPASPLHSILFISHTISATLPPAGTQRGLLRATPREMLTDGSVPYSPSSALSPLDVLPSNEYILEALDNVWLRMHSGGVYSKGALLFSTHRVIFIQNPSESSESFVVTIPLTRIASVSIRRRWKDKFNTMALLCRDQIGYLFVCLRDENEIRTLEAFRRIKTEIKWRRDEDTFWIAQDSLVMSEHLVRLVGAGGGNDAAYGNTLCSDGDGETVLSRSGAARGDRGLFVSPSSSANDFSSVNVLVSGGVTQKSQLAARCGSEDDAAEAKDDDKDFFWKVGEISDSTFDDDIAAPFDLSAEYDRLGINDMAQWRISTANHDFSVCPTYPRDLVVPTVISDRHLAVAASQRSAGRLPVLTWIHPNGAALCRSSQPLVGIATAACPEDEALLMTIRACAFGTQDAEGDPWWCEEVVTEEEKSFVTQSTDSPWTEVMSVKGLASVAPMAATGICCGAGHGADGASARMERPLSETSPHSSTAALNTESTSNNGNTSPLDDDGLGRSTPTSPCRPPDSPPIKPKRLVASGAVRVKDLQDIPQQQLHRTTSGSTHEEPSSAHNIAMAVPMLPPPHPGRVRRRDDPSGTWDGGRLLLEGALCGCDDERHSSTGSSDAWTGIGGDSACGWDEGGNLRRISSTGSVSTAAATASAVSGDEMGCSTLEGKRLRIVDARPIINAKGNALMGKGHEIIGRLGGEMCTTLSFAGIANIHVMRENYGALRQICCELTRSCNWFHMLQETKWLLHLSTLIKGSLVVALHLERGDPVLVHCSDGWDRTAQMVSLAQLMLDPYYRTIAGFRSLISKDFSTFGHMFHHRSGLVSPEEGSPIFLQFLDAVWQIWRQMPWEFEFTDSLLELIAYAVGTRFTDDFVFDNEKSRLEFEDVLKQIVKTSHCSSCRAKDMTAAATVSTPNSCDENTTSCSSATPTESDAHTLLTDDTGVNATWRNTGGRDAGSASPTMSNQSGNRDVLSGCDECCRRVRACKKSIWTYVSRNLTQYRNPLYHPTASDRVADGGVSSAVTSSVSEQLPLSSGPPRFSTSGCTPVHGGGSYYSPSAGGDCAAEGGLNTAYAVDFGEFSDDDDSDKGESRTDYASRTGHKMGTATDSMHVDAAGMGDDVRDGLHQTEREREGFRKIFGDGSSRSLSSGDEGTGGTLDVEAPTQLFVVAQPVATPLDRTPPTAVRYGSGPINLHMPDNSQVPATQSDMTEPVGSGINRLSGMNIDAATPHVMDSNAHPGIAAQRPTRLLRPCFDIQAMAVWEGVHFSSIPMAHTFTAASASFSRGLEILHREELGKNKQLEELVHSQERTIRELSEQLQAQKKKVMHLEKELATSTAAAAALDEKRNSATLGDNCLDIDDYVMFGETEEHLFRCVDKREENRGRILSTGLLIENYMRG